MPHYQKSSGIKPPRTRFYKRKSFWFLLSLLFIVLPAIGGAIAAKLAWNYAIPYRERAETYDMERINDLEIPSLILDRNGREIGRIFVQNRSIITIKDVPKIFIDALRAGEDQRYYTHNGVDFIGIARAAHLNWKAGKTTQGASTITQQLARNAYDLESERLKRGESGIQRKLIEAFLAVRIEQHYSKEQILEFYLNRIYFGSGYYGIRSASLGYFGKEPRDLTALESAAMVGCIKNPTNLSPLNSAQGNRNSRNLVLGRMVDIGALSRRQSRELMDTPLALHPNPIKRGTSHLYERIANTVNAALGEDALATGGFTIHTTILAEAQQAAEATLSQTLARAEQRPGYSHQTMEQFRNLADRSKPEFLQGACLMIDHETGEVLAHVGGRNYALSPYDFIELGKSPLGTAFFPFLYAAGLDRGLTPATSLEDEPMDNRAIMVGGQEGILGEWGMEVASPVYEGSITARHALEQSKIASTVRWADQVGLENIVKTASAFGFPMKNAELLRRLAVGFEEATLPQAVRAITAFPRGGKLGPETLIYVDRVVSPSGKVVYRRPLQASQPKAAIDPATAWQVHSMMAGSLYRGSSKGGLENLVEKPFGGAGKGGTTHDFSDCWFLGYNSRVTCGVWTGFLTGRGTTIYRGAFSRDLAMPVWQAAMNAAAPSFHGAPLQQPENIVEVPICIRSGQRATPYCQEYAEESDSGVVKSRSTVLHEYFRRGTERVAFCATHSGMSGDAHVPEHRGMFNLPALDAVPIHPKSSVLLGDDPYHTELPRYAQHQGGSGMIRRRTNVLDSLDLGDVEETIPLARPRRLMIDDE
jgi:membrane carboxypeptidase/penicillin-binding protein